MAKIVHFMTHYYNFSTAGYYNYNSNFCEIITKSTSKSAVLETYC